jgi:hypothetical protein
MGGAFDSCLLIQLPIVLNFDTEETRLLGLEIKTLIGGQ